jgi:hypothetical protein
MGFFDRLTSSFSSANQGVKLVEQWCAELGWGIDDRLDSTGIILDFKSPFGVRKVMIAVTDSGRIGSFVTFSAADLHVHQLTGKLMAYLLCQNREILGGWHMKIKDDGTIKLGVSNTMILPGMTAGEFKAVCTQLATEANDLDTKLNNSEF